MIIDLKMNLLFLILDPRALFPSDRAVKVRSPGNEDGYSL